jgi:hypothetical protein
VTGSGRSFPARPGRLSSRSPFSLQYSPTIAGAAAARRLLTLPFRLQLLGVATVGYVIRLGRLVSAAPETSLAAIAPTRQRYLTEELALP